MASYRAGISKHIYNPHTSRTKRRFPVLEGIIAWLSTVWLWCRCQKSLRCLKNSWGYHTNEIRNAKLWCSDTCIKTTHHVSAIYESGTFCSYADIFFAIFLFFNECMSIHCNLSDCLRLFVGKIDATYAVSSSFVVCLYAVLRTDSCNAKRL